jgi:hypothetical protein
MKAARPPAGDPLDRSSATDLLLHPSAVVLVEPGLVGEGVVADLVPLPRQLGQGLAVLVEGRVLADQEARDREPVALQPFEDDGHGVEM